MKALRFIASDPQIDIEVAVGNFGAQLVGGLGGYQEIERQDDVSITDWNGQDALRQDVSILLDGWAKGDSIERELNTILKLGRDPNGERVPPVFRVFGPVYYPGKAWVLPADGIDLNGGDIAPIRRRGDGELLRQEVILHLLEYVRPDTVKLRGKRAKTSKKIGVGPPHALTYDTRAGDTLTTIATRVLGDWKQWNEIGKLNGLTDPNRAIPAGRTLRLP